MMTRRFTLLGMASLATLAASNAAAEAPVDAAAPVSADEILVTAQLRAQNPIEVPITLSVTTGEELSRLGIEDFEEFSRFVPGFEVQNQSPNNPGFVMRGITSDSGSAITSRASRSFRTASRSPSRAAPMSNCST